MKKPPPRQFDPNVLAVLHRAGRSWRVLIVQTPLPGRGLSPAAVAWREFSADQAGRMESWIDEQNAGEILCVLPASLVICRTCSLPDAPLEHLEPALRLQAEAHLFGIAPSHRLGMAVLEAAAGETTRAGIILAWPESASLEAPPIHRPMRFVPDIASLAALLDGMRPTQPLVWLDRNDGSLALALSHASGAAFRAVREDAGDTEEWKSGVGRVIAETGLSAGHTASFIESLVRTMHERLDAVPAGGACLMIPQAVRESAASRLMKAPDDEGWWSNYGIAAGAALARIGDLAALTQLQQSPPIETPSFLTRLTHRLAQPRTARAAVIACVLVLLFGPLVMSGLRLAVLNIRHADLDQRLRQVNETRNHLVVYRELERGAWSMTKLLADIACNTPEGIELDTIRSQAQSRNFIVTGRALPRGGRSAVELVHLMQEQLLDSGIFHEVTLTRGDPDAYRHYTFTIQAKLLRPHRKHNYPEDLDFASRTLFDRLYPEAASRRNATTEAPSSPSDVRADAGPPPASTPAETPNGSNGRSTARQTPIREPGAVSAFGGDQLPSRRDPAGAASVSAPSGNIPDPLTPEQIAAMTQDEAKAALTHWSAARNAARLRNDDELEQRLRREFEMLMERLRGGA